MSGFVWWLQCQMSLDGWSAERSASNGSGMCMAVVFFSKHKSNRLTLYVQLAVPYTCVAATQLLLAAQLLEPHTTGTALT